MPKEKKVADIRSLASAVRALLEDYRNPALLATYFADGSHSGFAGRLFDTYGNNPDDNFSGDDLLAASMLDVRFGPSALRRIVLDGDFRTALEKLNVDYPSSTIIDMADEDDLFNRVDVLYRQLQDVAGVGPTRASKLLARKRPSLIPIGDSVILRAFGVTDNEHWWQSLGEALKRPEIATALAKLAAPLHDVEPLRVLDVAAWMLHSRSRAAKAA